MHKIDSYGPKSWEGMTSLNEFERQNVADDEIDSLMKNNTWNIFDIPEAKNQIPKLNT